MMTRRPARTNLLDSIGAAELRLDSQVVESNAVAIWRDAPVSGPRFLEDFSSIAAPDSLTTVNCSSGFPLISVVSTSTASGSVFIFSISTVLSWAIF